MVKGNNKYTISTQETLDSEFFVTDSHGLF